MTGPPPDSWEVDPAAARAYEVADGIWRLRLPMPYPQIGTVNAHLLDGHVLVDCGGGGDATAYAALRAALEEAGASTITDLVITHFHSDHMGCAARLVADTGCTVWAHPASEHLLGPHAEPERHRELRAQAADRVGITEPGFWEDFVDTREETDGIDGPVAPDHLLTDGTVIPGGWEVRETPGHAPSQVVLFHPDRRILIAADLIGSVFAPFFDLGPQDPVAEHRASLGVAAGLGAELALPGHGRPLEDLPGVFADQHRGLDERLDAVRAALAGRAATPAELVDDIFPATADRTLLHLLRAQAEALGDDTWLVFDGAERVGFRTAYEETNAVAHALLRDLGEPGHAGLFLRNQPEFYPAFLGPMAAGGVTVPLNADSRGPLLEDVIRRSRIRALIARADLLDRLAAIDLGAVELVVVAGEWDGAPVGDVRTVGYDAWLEGVPRTPPRELPSSRDVALIQFTSGTTGRSKGVVYPHHFLYLYSAVITDRMAHTRDSVLFSPMPLFHVAALHLCANAALHAGCQAHLRSRFSATAFWDQVAECGATNTVILGPMAQIILKVCEQAPEHKLGIIYCVPFPPGGEEFQERFRVKLVWQGFGMTEIYTNPYHDHPHEDVPRNRIGHPVAWMDYGVVDERDRLVAPGETGQLVFRPRLPDAMAREYFEDPEATVAAFRNFMFHTGDLATYDEDGALYFGGRKQDRIRRRGENVSAAELEAIANGHPAVVEAAAYGVPGEFGEHEVKLDLVLRPDAPGLADLHAWLAERLPRYMVPRYLEACDAFPKTPSERVEKYKLLARGLERPEVAVFDGVRA